jgi:hypothetical protein
MVVECEWGSRSWASPRCCSRPSAAWAMSSIPSPPTRATRASRPTRARRAAMRARCLCARGPPAWIRRTRTMASASRRESCSPAPTPTATARAASATTRRSAPAPRCSTAPSHATISANRVSTRSAAARFRRRLGHQLSCRAEASRQGRARHRLHRRRRPAAEIWRRRLRASGLSAVPAARSDGDRRPRLRALPPWVRRQPTPRRDPPPPRGPTPRSSTPGSPPIAGKPTSTTPGAMAYATDRCRPVRSLDARTGRRQLQRSWWRQGPGWVKVAA